MGSNSVYTFRQRCVQIQQIAFKIPERGMSKKSRESSGWYAFPIALFPFFFLINIPYYSPATH